MKQLSLFDDCAVRELATVPTPKDVADYLEILGVRYSLKQVDGWCAVKDFKMITERYMPSKSIPLADGVVWVDPETISVVYKNFNNMFFWGWGPLYSVIDGQPVYMSYSGKTEQVGFNFVDIESWKIAHEAWKKKMSRRI